MDFNKPKVYGDFYHLTKCGQYLPTYLSLSVKSSKLQCIKTNREYLKNQHTVLGSPNRPNRVFKFPKTIPGSFKFLGFLFTPAKTTVPILAMFILK